jgi:hypothetical protein
MGKVLLKSKYVVYSAVFGGYDDLHEPINQVHDVDFILFTDNLSLKSDVWKIIFVSPLLQANMMNRYFKLHPHEFLKEYESSLYVDSNIILLESPFELFSKYLGSNNFAAPRHNLRSCIYEEAISVVEKKKANHKDVHQQMDFYLERQFPRRFGLLELNVIFRNHNHPAVKELMMMWWQQINTYTQRDQLSFLYCCWSLNFKPLTMFESTRFKNKYFYIVTHNDINMTFLSKVKKWMKRLMLKSFLKSSKWRR